MPTFSAYLTRTVSTTLTVEADTPDEAVTLAYDAPGWPGEITQGAFGGASVDCGTEWEVFLLSDDTGATVWVDPESDERRLIAAADELEAARGALTAVYRERAHLVAFLAAMCTAVLTPDPDDPDYHLLYVTETTADGSRIQMSWHIHQADLDLFAHVPRVDSHQWDGHSTAEKYAALRRLTVDMAALGGGRG